MSSQEKAQWDLAKFLTTLDYFGEIPFVGSFRWVQQLLGKNPTVPGVTMSAVKKAVVIGDRTSDLFNSLQSQNLSSADLIFYPLASVPATVATGELSQLIRAADTVIVLAAPAASTLAADLAVYLGETASVEQTIFDFSKGDLSAWGELDDVVMGGVSQGSFFLRDQSAVFAGSVSTENSGGFSSVRTKNFDPPFSFSGWRGLRLKVKGDGQRYKLILRNNDGWDSPGYIHSFETTADAWTVVDIPFDELVPTFRARSLPDAAPFDPARIVSLQLMLSKFEYDQRLNPQFTAGPFQLVVSDIGAYRPRRGVPLVAIAQDKAEHERLQAALANAPVDYRLIEPGREDLLGAITQALA